MPDATAPLRFEYAREPDVSAQLDRELRALISGCFDQPHNAFFRERRYAQETPAHRFMLRSEGGPLVGHIAVHEKRISVAGAELQIGGLAEVCVQLSERGHGHFRRLLAHSHEQLAARGIEYTLLLGEPALYAPGGYRPLDASIRRFDPKTQSFEDGRLATALYKSLTQKPWPTGPVDLRGPLF
ncbi:MAG TPA: GNAT family N-acetyltransferase [Polyangiaceae bacterium]|jgi:predicted N-acetyltransferase YhbS|nr:GNAT family N-acetyltransferase [Polyangiaceae bacterium]